MVCSNPLLSIIIISFNTREETVSCLQSIINSNVSFLYEIVLVDNNSTDDTVSYVTKNFPVVQLVKLQSNTGFSFANNRGVDASKGDYLLFLNSDTLFLADTLKNIGLAVERKKESVIVPTLLNLDLSVQKNLFSFPRYSKTFLRISGLYEAFAKRFKVTKRTKMNSEKFDYASFAAIIFKASVYKAVGRLDENIYFYHEDCDMGFKLKNSEISMSLSDSIKLIHIGGNTTSKFSEFSFENDVISLNYIFRKNYHRSPAWLILLVLRLSISVRIILLSIGLIKGIEGFTAYNRKEGGRFESKKKHFYFLLRVMQKLK